MTPVLKKGRGLGDRPEVYSKVELCHRFRQVLYFEVSGLGGEQFRIFELGDHQRCFRVIRGIDVDGTKDNSALCFVT